MEGDDPGAALSLSLLLHETEIQLRLRADAKVRNALAIAVLADAGHQPREIRERLGLTADEYRRAHEWLRDAIKATSREDA
jgi:hypothetical protein